MSNTFQKFRFVVVSAISKVLSLKGVFAKALLVPFVFYLVLDSAVYLEQTLFTSIVVGVASIMIHTLFAITTHRIILLGPESVPEWGVLFWSSRETSFAFHALGIGFVAVPLAILAFVPIVGVGLFIGGTFWLFGRLSLVFPAIAIDQNASFKHSWKLTQNYQTLMVLVVIFFPIVLMLPARLVLMFPFTLYISSVLSTLSTIFMVAALSITYQKVILEVSENQ